uniref:Uncharacterized protein n=1 Tax=Avena sativa TaxID=4498 RepID=A0ACD5VJP3_AVESA
MAPPSPKNPNLYSYHLCVLLLVSTTTLSAAISTSYSTLCPSSLTPAQDIQTDHDDILSLTRSFQISTGYFSGGDGNLFSADDDDLYNSYRSFSLFPHGASRTSDKAIVHLTATLTITGPRRLAYTSRGHRHNYTVPVSISFILDGYYSPVSFQLCMVGSGTEQSADGSLKHYPDVALRLRVPSPPSLADPFVTGTLKGSDDFGTIHLLAYAEGDDYKYRSESSKHAACRTPRQTAIRGSFQALGGNGSAWCAHLKEQLVTSYRLEHSGATGPLLGRLRESRKMDVNQMQCTEDGAVRAYVVFSNHTAGSERHGFYYYRQRRFLVDEEAVVAEGRWDFVRGVLCLKACRVARSVSAPSALASVREDECGIGMSFWFPAVWTMRDRSVVAGMLWNSTQETTPSGNTAGVITASSIEMTDHDQIILDVAGNHRSSNLSDVKYSYNDTMLEEAKNHYHLKFKKEIKIKGSHSFPGKGNYTYRDFEFRFFGEGMGGNGQAYPVTIGSVMVVGDRLAADDSFSHRHAELENGLLKVSYDIQYSAPREEPRITNGSYMLTPEEQERVSAEGVYDPEKGILCMVGCREHNGSTECQILVTVKFSSLHAGGHEHGRGVISSLRDNKTDPLFFEKIDIRLYGMYSHQVSEAISRMDLESVLLVASATLSCVFAVLQILHTKRNPEAAAATSVTMLAILTLGYLTPLVLNFEAMFRSRRSRYFGYSMAGPLEIKEVMMRVPILVAFVLQLRLLQLAWSGRRRPADQTPPPPPPVVSERIVLQICLPLYLLGAVLAATVHVIKVRAAAEHPLVVRVGGEPATIWEDLVSYAGLILDGFLLPQVILNASLAGAGSAGARAISPWFYIGCTMNRAMPHVYDVVRGRIFEQSISPSDLYASPRGDLFGVAWDVVIPCGAALLAALLFLQQRRRGAASLPSRRKASGGYELVSNI